MRVGDLVRVVSREVPDPIEVGDLAILTQIDWDHRHHPDGILSRDGKRHTGRGYFYFPNKPEVQQKWRPLGVMLLFESFEVVSGTNS